MISAISPNQEGVVGTDSEEVWIHTETSAILVMSTSLLGTVLFFLIKEAYFYAGSLLVTSRCAIRGNHSSRLCHSSRFSHSSRLNHSNRFSRLSWGKFHQTHGGRREVLPEF